MRNPETFGNSRPTSVFDTPRLLDNPFVQLPEHGFTPEYIPEQVAIVEDIAESFAKRFEPDDLYPNAKFILNYSASDNRSDAVYFMFAWGKATEYPVPRAWKLTDYFSAEQLETARAGNETLEASTLDAYGYAGGIRFDAASPQIAVMGMELDRPEYKVKQRHARDELIVSDMKQLMPLRLRAGVRHNPASGDTSIKFGWRDQHQTLDRLIRALRAGGAMSAKLEPAS